MQIPMYLADSPGEVPIQRSPRRQRNQQVGRTVSASSRCQVSVTSPVLPRVSHPTVLI